MATGHEVRLPLMTPEEAAPTVRQTTDWMGRWSRTGRIPSHKLGKKRLFCQACLEEIARQMYEPAKQGSQPGRTPARQPARAAGRRYARQSGRYPRSA